MTVDPNTLAADLDALLARLTPRLRPGGGDWLADARARLRDDPASLAKGFAAAGRKAGRGALVEAPRRERLRAGGPVLDRWTVDDAARVVLLLEEAIRDGNGVESRAVELYAHGELGERIAVVRGLQLVPAESDGLGVIRDALRSNVRDLFAAAIGDNLFTSDRLPDELFFQAVLKCAFVELPLGRIERLEERATPELARMLYAYVTERDAAGRPVPDDLWPVIALHPPPGAEARLERARAGAGKPVAGGGRLPE